MARNKKYVTVKGVKMTKKEYKDFVAYLNARRVQEFSKNDAAEWLEFRRSGDWSD
jgi:hypothetical protein